MKRKKNKAIPIDMEVDLCDPLCENLYYNRGWCIIYSTSLVKSKKKACSLNLDRFRKDERCILEFGVKNGNK